MPKLPSVSLERVIRALQRAGFAKLRQPGSHVALERRIGDQIFKTVVPLQQELREKAPSPTSSSKSGFKPEQFLELL